MKNSALALLNIFTLIILFGSCTKDPVVGPVNIDIEDEFNVLLWESLSENERAFNLNIETILSNSCENAEIEYTQYSQPEGIFVTVKDIINDHCTAGTFPAKANVPIGVLTVDEYDLDINLKNVIPNKGKLLVTNDYYEITISDPNGIIIPNNRLYKIPENSIWGYVAYEDASGEVPHDNFMAELNDVTNSISPTPGNYGYFNIEQNNSILLSDNLSQLHIKPFIFKYDGTDNQLENLRATYNSSNFPGMAFKIYTSTGKVF